MSAPVKMSVKLPEKLRRSERASSSAPVDKVGGKGHATPSRKVAQAAAKERAKAGADKKAAQKVLRERQSTANQKMREGMKNGDERYLMERDKGPVKRFVRDFVDTRFSFMEYLLPVLVIIMVMQFSKVGSLVRLSSGLWSASVILLVLDVLWLNFKLGREVKTRFPDENTRGWRFYAFMRAIQLRRLRLPKPRFKLRDPLPETYN
ncbi:MAG: rane protein [Nocardioidaceae bacterium]|nr:rane protein [Nocardioidaceae bacterium]